MAAAPAKVLIVDDDPFFCTLLESLLLPEGYQVAFAISGEEAIKVAQNDPPDLILLDVMLPGMDGFSTCKELSKTPSTQDVPIIFLSGKGNTEDRVRGLNVGAADYICKPFDPEELLARVRSRVRSARSIHASMKELEALRRDISNAQEIQQSLLPQSFPPVLGLDVFGQMRPARGVSGDYFDVIPRGENVMFCVGDVSGKGTSAGLVMVMARLFLRHWEYDPADTKKTLLAANIILHANTNPYVFMSMVLLSWHVSTRKMVFTGAGQENILVYRAAADKVETVAVGGVVLGLRTNIAGNLRTRPLELGAGDAVLLYTDGITDAVNPAGETFGLRQLQERFGACAKLDAKSAVETLLKEIEAFGGGAEQADDITAFVLKRLPE